MRKVWSILFVGLFLYLLCRFFYFVGITNIGHNERVIIAPEHCSPGDLLRVNVSRLDTLVIEHLEDTVNRIEVK